MLTLAEISLFIPETMYLVKGEMGFVSVASAIVKKEEVEETEVEEEVAVEKEVIATITKKANYNPVLFILDTPLKGASEEMFSNLVGKALSLSEKDYSTLLQDDVLFEKLEEINSNKIISFGVAFSGLTEMYKMKSEKGKLTLYIDSLDKIVREVDLKRQLWAQLQLMFPKN